ncbi:MAG TPA: cupin domain-containing protein [Candidatus Angelobacter sp.]|nr:cupin domain-containing protein [Candidatus Angelobacter sp.]
MFRRFVCGLLLLIGPTCFLLAQDADTMTYAAAATSKFGNMAGLPTCMTLSVQRGDPSKGPAVILLKFKAGCTVPWHWHTAAEQLIVISGTGAAQMKDGKPVTVHPGDYFFLPAKHIHQFTATTALTMFDLPDGAFDIHYVDAAGTEIPPDQALKQQMSKVVVKPAAAPTEKH